MTMKIIKRDGASQDLSFDKVLYRIQNLCNDTNLGALDGIDVGVVAQKVVSTIYDGVKSSELDEEAARLCASITENESYTQLSSRIIISNLHKNTCGTFSETCKKLYEANAISESFAKNVFDNSSRIDAEINHQRDYNFDYFGFKTLEKSYLLRINDVVVERPQYLYMRVSLAIHNDNLERAFEIYHLMSQHYYTHASPTLFNAGTKLGANSSCFLLGTEDSIEGIYKTLSDIALISKTGGGIGVHVSNIRSEGSIIRGTNGKSDGIVPMLKVYNATSAFVNQSGKRKGSFAIYLEPWHPEILDFLELKKNQGAEERRARNLFYSIWTPDYFMRQVESDGDWYLMCPDECPGLQDAYAEDFDKLYDSYIATGKFRRVVKARTIWNKILEAQIETGVPYIGYKDAVNKKCNQKNLGTIKSSNLCSEISLYSDEKNYAVCNLCSIALPKFVLYNPEGLPYFDFDLLHNVAKTTVIAMNKVIDNNYYPTPEAKRSDDMNRPLGIGIQGLVDVYIKMRFPFESQEAKQLNKEIFETIYHGLIEQSMELSKVDGPYKSFAGSPFSEGKLQFDLAAEFDGINIDEYLSGRYNWSELKEAIREHGIRNSMLTALMPTASTAQIMRNSESFEVMNSCIFKRRVLSGEFIVLNRYLVHDLTKLGLWNLEMKDRLIIANGSVQNIPEIPQNIKDLYKTAWEISMKAVIDQSADRGVFIDQMQSMNLYIANPTIKKLSSMHFYGWKKHLKTGIYYLRSKSVASSGKFSVDAELEKAQRQDATAAAAALQCSIDNKDECVMCSS